MHLTEAWSPAILLPPRSGIVCYNLQACSILAWVRSHDRKPFGPARLPFALISLLLLACVGLAGAQTLRSSEAGTQVSPNSLTGGHSISRNSVAFGSVNDAAPSAIDASVPGFTAMVGEDSSSGSMRAMTGTGQSGKGKASLSKLQPAGSATNMLFHQMQGMRLPEISGPNGAAQRPIAKTLLEGVAKPRPAVGTVVQSRMQPGSVPDVSDIKEQGAIQEQGAPSGDVDATESGVTAFETTAFPEDLEDISDPFHDLLEASFEELCSQNCGSLSNLSVTERGPASANAGRESKNRLSSPTTRHRFSNMAGDEEARKTLSARDARKARLEGGLSTHGHLSLHGRSSDPH